MYGGANVCLGVGCWGWGVEVAKEDLLVECRNLLLSVVLQIRSWLCVYSADPYKIIDHFFQFGTMSGAAKSGCSLMHLVWFACIWVIWKERNDMIFCRKENHQVHLLEKIKFLSFWWFKAHIIFHYSFHNWC